MDIELEKFKTEINLAEYVSSKGWDLVPGKSSPPYYYYFEKGGKGGQKIGISKNKRTGHDNYNDFKMGKGHGGTVIDFAQKVVGVGSLGAVRTELRSYLGSPPPKIRIARPAQRPTPQEQARILTAEKERTSPLQESSYLVTRGIPQDTLNDPRFKGRLFTDPRGNVLFPHNNAQGFSGYEKKNVKFTGFSPHGERGLWMSLPPKDFRKIVVTESGIDCLSHAILRTDPTLAYCSTAGQLSVHQEQLIEDLSKRHPDKMFVCAFDNDLAGKKYAADLQRVVGKDMCIIETPKEKDWNQDLQSNLKNRF